MKTSSILQIILLITFTWIAVPIATAMPLDGFRWKNRVIVLYLPDQAYRKPVTQAIAAQREGLRERDLAIIDASSQAAGIPGVIRLDAVQTAKLRSHLKIDKNTKSPVFVLLGKDGGEKGRQTGELNLADWFALIDRMPLRRDEIRKQNDPR